MKDQNLQLILKACLDRFEEHEIQLLSWGDTEGFFNKSEVDQIIVESLGKFPSGQKFSVNKKNYHDLP